MTDSNDARPAEEKPSNANIFDGYISEDEYARQRGVTLRTCQRDRALRQAPPHVVIGRAVYYRVEAVRQWLADRERDSLRTGRLRRSAGNR